MPAGSSDSFLPSIGGPVDRAVVIDDAPAVRQALVEGLVKAGVPRERVTAFETGDEALHQFSELKPDLVLIDTTTPGVDPFDAIQAMLLEAPDTHVVPVTEKTLEDDSLQEMLSLGAFAVVRKPVRSRDLEGVLREIDEERSGAGRIR